MMLHPFAVDFLEAGERRYESRGGLLDALSRFDPNFAACHPSLFRTAPHPLEDGLASCALALDHLDDIAIEQLRPLLPPDVQRAVPGRQRAFIGGRLCAELALRCAGLPGGPLTKGPRGEPQWPAGVSGSITHTHSMAYAAVGAGTRYLGVGIDSELVVDERALHDILAVCCDARERRLVLSSIDPCIAATLVFSAKESYFKAVHCKVKRFVGFEEALVESIDWPRGMISMLPASSNGGLPAAVTGFRISSPAAMVHTCIALSNPYAGASTR
jgi:enterobactin synthetase component D